MLHFHLPGKICNHVNVILSKCGISSYSLSNNPNESVSERTCIISPPEAEDRGGNLVCCTRLFQEGDRALSCLSFGVEEQVGQDTIVQ